MSFKRNIPVKQRKPWFLQQLINSWFNRLLGAASDRNFSGQEAQYAAGSTKRDYVWNTVGLAVWGLVFPLLTVVVTQVVGVEQAGMFSMAFVVGLLLMFVANYGVRTFQVSDLDEQHSFADYQLNRFATCVIMLAVGMAYCAIRGYSEEMFTVSMGVYVYKMVDGLADVYEGRLQQVGKLYLAGISLALRSALVVIVFSLCLLITRNLAVSCVAIAVVAAVSFFIVTLPLALLESPESRRVSLACVRDLFIQCFPLFLALFMFNLIDSMPKFAMEGVLSYDNQLYFNALYFPAQAILLAVQFIYRPQLVRMASLWADKDNRGKFDLMILIIIASCIALTVMMILLMDWIGIPILGFLYGIDFEEFRGLVVIMLIAGGVTAGIDFLYQAITVLRKQRAVLKLYFITFAFSLFIPVLLVQYADLAGVVLSYLIIMSILFVLLLSEYLSIRWGFSREKVPETTDRLTRWRAERHRLEQRRRRQEHMQDAQRHKDAGSDDDYLDDDDA
ncbi:MAG: lipopolysaccharide biosynthesis protein [Coriobacteriales bacterium]|jgi:O-antigen/teichoic acid export membrane protein|nr:lipopolysaccharide biosynthesis protein [Coriobacteriales bacterium]